MIPDKPEKINPLQIPQTGKTKKNALLTKKIVKSFGNNYLIPIFASDSTAVEQTTKQLKQLKINNLKLQNYESKKSFYRKENNTQQCK